MKIAVTLMSVAGLTLGLGCSPKPETMSEKVETKTETMATGEIATQTTTVEQETPTGTIDKAQETYVGVVTEFKAGDSLEVKLLNGETENFDLDDKDVAVEIGPSVRVGSKVEVTVNKYEGDKRQIRVFPTA
jgi:hypothetical protein